MDDSVNEFASEPGGPPNHGRVFEIAMEQSGYFTAAQARTCGFGWALLAHFAKRGRFVRIYRGLYRIRDFPPTPGEEVVAAWLAVGREAAVVSHETALDWLGLSDVVPDAIHLTVPRSHRYRAAPPGVKLHTSLHPPGPADIVVRRGLRVTSPTRTILDVAATGTAPEQVIAAARQALARGLATRAGLLDAARGRGARVRRLIQQAVDLESMVRP